MTPTESWAQLATRLWDAEEQRRDDERLELAGKAVERATSWWRAAGLGDELPEGHGVQAWRDPADVGRDGLLVTLPAPGQELARVGLVVLDNRRGVGVASYAGNRWHSWAMDGATAADLGRALVEEPPAPPAATTSPGDLLLQVLEAIVADAVDARVAGQL